MFDFTIKFADPNNPTVLSENERVARNYHQLVDRFSISHSLLIIKKLLQNYYIYFFFIYNENSDSGVLTCSFSSHRVWDFDVEEFKGAFKY